MFDSDLESDPRYIYGYRKEKDSREREEDKDEKKGGGEKRGYPLVLLFLTFGGSVSLLPQELCNWIGWHAQELSKFPAIFTTLTAIYAG